MWLQSICDSQVPAMIDAVVGFIPFLTMSNGTVRRHKWVAVSQTATSRKNIDIVLVKIIDCTPLDMWHSLSLVLSTAHDFGFQEKLVAVPFLARRMPSSSSAWSTCDGQFLLDRKVSVHEIKIVLHPRYVLDKAVYHLGFLVDMVCRVLTTKFGVILSPLIGWLSTVANFVSFSMAT